MALLAKRCDLFFFDIHIRLEPLESPELFADPFSFLASPEKYNEAHAKGDPIDSKSLSLRPLSAAEITQSHFWKHVGRPPKPEPAWEWHLPFLHTAASSEVRFVFDDLLTAPVETTIFVWPWGWSSNLSCSLRGDLDSDTLSQLIARQKSGNLSAGTFSFQNEILKCNDVFARLEDKIQRALYRSEIEEVFRLERHFVASIPTVQGEAQPYEWLPSLGVRPLKDSDRAALHSILLGRTVELRELAAREQADPRRFLLTRFIGIAFALSDFDRGSLLYLPGLVSKGKLKEEGAKYCLAVNIRNASLLSLALAALIREISASESENAAIRSLAESGRRILKRFSNARNAFQSGFATWNTAVAKRL